MNRIADLVPRFKGRRVVVLGDLAVDCFVETQPDRLSHEAPVMVLRFRHRRYSPGCAANTVMNLHRLGAEVIPIGIVGEDEPGRALLRQRLLACCKLEFDRRGSVIDYRRENVPARVRELTDGAGVPVVYDGVGKATAEKSLDCLAPRGTMVFFGNASGPVDPIDPLVLSQKGSLFLTRPVLFHYIPDRPSLEARSADVLGGVASGSLKVRIGRTFPLAEAADAHRTLEAGGHVGKLVLTT